MSCVLFFMYIAIKMTGIAQNRTKPENLQESLRAEKPCSAQSPGPPPPWNPPGHLLLMPYFLRNQETMTFPQHLLFLSSFSCSPLRGLSKHSLCLDPTAKERNQREVHILCLHSKLNHYRTQSCSQRSPVLHPAGVS